MWLRISSLSLGVTALLAVARVTQAEGGTETQLPSCGAPSPASATRSPPLPAPTPPAPGSILADDRVGYPGGYRSTFTQFYVFDRFDARTISYVCANEIAARVQPGEPYPYGSVLVFESWRPVVDEENALVQDANGHLVRDALTGIFVMRKEPGFGLGYGAARSGEWEYVAFRPDGSYQTPPAGSAGCASCHQAGVGATRDYVFRTNLRSLPGQYARSDEIGEGEVGITRMGFRAANRSIPVGTTIVWRNSSIDQTPHSVAAGGGAFDSGVLAPGATYSHTFTTPGRYEYACVLHPELMRGVIEVTN